MPVTPDGPVKPWEKSPSPYCWSIPTEPTATVGLPVSLRIQPARLSVLSLSSNSGSQ